MMDDCMGAGTGEGVEIIDGNMAMAKPMRTPKSTPKGRNAEIDKWMERGVVERWSRTEMLNTVVSVFRSWWVGDPFKETRRHLICDYATRKGPTVFAAASDQSFSRLAGLKAIKDNYPRCLFDDTRARTSADELCFFEATSEDRELHLDCVWRTVRVFCSHRRGARAGVLSMGWRLRRQRIHGQGHRVEPHVVLHRRGRRRVGMTRRRRQWYWQSGGYMGISPPLGESHRVEVGKRPASLGVSRMTS